jgi:hypothetical protein
MHTAMALADAEAGGGRGGKEAARLAAEAQTALDAALAQPLFADRRKVRLHSPLQYMTSRRIHGSIRQTAVVQLVADVRAVTS